MAYGTESVAPVDVIVGPGNAYVAEAKRQVSGVVGVASAFAGPSEVVVVAGPETPAELAAVDLVVQAEHGPDGLAWLVTWSRGAGADEVDEGGRPARGRLAASGRPRGDARDRRLRLRGRRARAGHRRGQRGRPRAPRAAGRRRRRPAAPGARRRGRLPRAVGAGQPAATTWPGPTTCCRPTGTARFASALARRRLPCATSTPCRSARSRRWPRSGPHVVTLAETEGLPAHAESIRVRLRAMSPVARWSAPRPAAGPEAGYHSPQVTVRGPAQHERVARSRRRRASRDGAGRGARSRDRLPPLPGPRRRRAAPGRSPRCHGVGPDQVFCANGSNEVLQCLLLAYGGPGRSGPLFEPTYTLHRHIAALTGTEVVDRRARRDDFRIDRPRSTGCSGPTADRVVTFVCSPNNPTGRAEPPDGRAPGARAAPRPGRGRRGLRPVRPRSALELAGRVAAAAWWWCGPSRRPGRWPRCRLGYAVADPEVVAACEQVALPYHLDAATQAGRQPRAALRRRDGGPGGAWSAERERLAAALADLPVDTWPSDANFILFRPRRRAGRGGVAAACSSRPSSCGTARPGRGSTGCLRVTVGTPAENDRFLDALGVAVR